LPPSPTTARFRAACIFRSIASALTIHREHGILSQEELRGQLPITADDYARIPEITVPENIERTGTTRQGLPAIVYRKQSNGVTYLVEEVRHKRGQLATTAIYKLKSGSEPTGKATPAETDARYNRDTPPLSEDSIGPPRPQVNQKAGPEGMADSAPGGVTGTSSHSFSQPAQMAGAGQVKVKASEIIQALSDAIGTPFRVGHGFFAQRKAAGCSSISRRINASPNSQARSSRCSNVTRPFCPSQPSIWSKARPASSKNSCRRYFSSFAVIPDMVDPP